MAMNRGFAVVLKVNELVNLEINPNNKRIKNRHNSNQICTTGRYMQGHINCIKSFFKSFWLGDKEINR